MESKWKLKKIKLNDFFPNIFVSNFESCLFIAKGNIVNQIGTNSMLKEAFNFDFILFFQPQLENKMAANHISYLITHNFLIRPPIFIKFISKCLTLKAFEFEVHINLGYQNTLTHSTCTYVMHLFYQ